MAAQPLLLSTLTKRKECLRLSDRSFYGCLASKKISDMPCLTLRALNQRGRCYRAALSRVRCIAILAGSDVERDSGSIFVKREYGTAHMTRDRRLSTRVALQLPFNIHDVVSISEQTSAAIDALRGFIWQGMPSEDLYLCSQPRRLQRAEKECVRD